jgi:hypothetical protein
MCVGSAPKVAPPPPPPPAVEPREPDIQISSKKSRDTLRKSSSSGRSVGLNRFLIVPGSSGAGANVPQ